MTIAVVLGLAALAGAIAALPARRRPAARDLPHRPDPGTPPSPERHRHINAHTGSLSATEILARLKRGEDPLP